MEYNSNDTITYMELSINVDTIYHEHIKLNEHKLINIPKLWNFICKTYTVIPKKITNLV